MLFTYTVNGFAASIIIEPGAEEVVFNPTSKDLFEDFKNMMPGDIRTQQIALVNSEQDANITVYMRAEVEEKDKDVLRWYKISIFYSESKNDKGIIVAENVLSVEGALKNDVKLCTLKPGQTSYITVTIECDIMMSNDYALTEGTIHWIFSVEEEKITTKPTTEPTTKPTTQPTTKPSTEPSSQSTTQPTTQPSTRPTTKPEEPTSAVPTTQPEEPTTKNSVTPFTGSEDILAPAAAIMMLSIVTIIVIARHKQKGEKANET